MKRVRISDGASAVDTAETSCIGRDVRGAVARRQCAFRLSATIAQALRYRRKPALGAALDKGSIEHGCPRVIEQLREITLRDLDGALYFRRRSFRGRSAGKTADPCGPDEHQASEYRFARHGCSLCRMGAPRFDRSCTNGPV